MTMSRPSERELQALKILWELGGGTVRDVCAALERRGEQLAYTTVLSLLQVMEQKGLVSHKADGKVYTYFAQVERDSTVRTLTQDFLDQVFDGAVAPFVLEAVQGQRLTPDEIGHLEALLARAKAASTVRDERPASSSAAAGKRAAHRRPSRTDR